MPLPAEEVLNRLVEATTEAKTTIRELHEARATAMEVMKKQRKQITDTVIDEIERQVGELALAAQSEMRDRVGVIIDRIEADWRVALKLDG